MEPSAAGQQNRLRHYDRECDAVSAFNLLTGPRLLEQVEALLPDHPERLMPPTESLAMFVGQARSPDGRCQEAVNAFQVRRLREGLTPGSTDTGAYCKARSRLPLERVAGLARACGGQLSAQATMHWRWQGRRVLLVDGSVIILPDSEANLAAYPQAHSQQPGLGFPTPRLVALICRGSGAVCDAAVGPCVGEYDDDGVRLHPLFILMAQPRVALRPRRIAPRLVKRRRNRFGLMMQPREQARTQVRDHGHPKKQK